MVVFGAEHVFDRDSTLLNDPCVILVHAHVVIMIVVPLPLPLQQSMKMFMHVARAHENTTVCGAVICVVCVHFMLTMHFLFAAMLFQFAHHISHVHVHVRCNKM